MTKIIKTRNTKVLMKTGKFKLLYMALGNVKWYNHSGKQHNSLCVVKIYLLRDSAIALLGIYPEK